MVEREASLSLLCFKMAIDSLVNILKDLNVKWMSLLCTRLISSKPSQNSYLSYAFGHLPGSCGSPPVERTLHEYCNIVCLVLCSITLMQSKKLWFGRLCCALHYSGGVIHIDYNVPSA